jgi:hypothetical protein
LAAAPAGTHADCCPDSDEQHTAWAVAATPDEVEELIDFLAGLPRAGRYQPLGDGLALWRGALASDGQGIVEEVTNAVISTETADDRSLGDTVGLLSLRATTH